MSIERTPISSRKGIKISEATRSAYDQRDQTLDSNDPEVPTLPPDRWATAMRRDEFFRPIKNQISARIDADVLEWLKSGGDGHLTRINAILREAMNRERGVPGEPK